MHLINVTILLFLLYISIDITTQDEQTIEQIKTQIIKLGMGWPDISERNVNFALNVFHLYISFSQLYQSSNEFVRVFLQPYLGFRNDSDTSKYLQSLRELTERIEKSTGLKLENTIFLHNNDSLNNSWLEKMKTSFNADIINLDSGINEQEGANIINHFVTNKTKNLTTPLIDKPIFNNTKLTLVSISRIETLLDSKYKTSNIIEAPFYTPDENITMQMIDITENACYKETPSFRTAKIQLSKSISLGIAMNDVRERISDLKELKKIIIQSCDRVLLNIQLPCITSNLFSWNYMSTFVQSYFNEFTENIEHLTKGKFYNIFSSQLDERVIKGLMLPSSRSHNRFQRSTDRVQFVVNKPFYFWLSDSETETLLFLGKVSNPNLKK